MPIYARVLRLRLCVCLLPLSPSLSTRPSDVFTYPTQLRLSVCPEPQPRAMHVSTSETHHPGPAQHITDPSQRHFLHHSPSQGHTFHRTTDLLQPSGGTPRRAIKVRFFHVFLDMMDDFSKIRPQVMVCRSREALNAIPLKFALKACSARGLNQISTLWASQDVGPTTYQQSSN